MFETDHFFYVLETDMLSICFAMLLTSEPNPEIMLAIDSGVLFTPLFGQAKSGKTASFNSLNAIQKSN